MEDQFENKFDELFDAALSEAAKKHEFVPDPEQSWLKVERKLKRQSQNRARLRAIPYIAISFVLGALIFGTPAVSTAFNLPFVKSILSIKDDVAHIVFGNDEGAEKSKAKTPPPPGFSVETPQVGEDVESIVYQQRSLKSWAEASKQAAFETPNIEFVPAGYKLDEVIGFFHPSGKEKANRLVFFYSGSGEGNYRIAFTPFRPNEKLSSSYRIEDGTLETILINNKDAYLFVGKDGTTSIEYIMGSTIFTMILGNLSKEEIVKVAENIRFK